jgi:hypothetical protein
MRLSAVPLFGSPEKAGCFLRLFVENILCVNSYTAQCAVSVQDCGKVRPPNLLLIRPKKVRLYVFVRRCMKSRALLQSHPAGLYSHRLSQLLNWISCQGLYLHQWSLASQILTRSSYVTVLYVSIALQSSLIFQVPVTHVRSRSHLSVPSRRNMTSQIETHSQINTRGHAATCSTGTSHSILLSTTWIRNLQIPSRNWKANGYPRCRDLGKKPRVVNLFKIPCLEPQSFQCSQWPATDTEYSPEIHILFPKGTL